MSPRNIKKLSPGVTKYVKYVAPNGGYTHVQPLPMIDGIYNMATGGPLFESQEIAKPHWWNQWPAVSVRAQDFPMQRSQQPVEHELGALQRKYHSLCLSRNNQPSSCSPGKAGKSGKKIWRIFVGHDSAGDMKQGYFGKVSPAHEFLSTIPVRCLPRLIDSRCVFFMTPKTSMESTD